MLLTTLFFFSLGQVVSPCLRYLMAVQNHLLSNTILIHPDDGDDSDSSLQGETMKVQVNTPLNTPTFVHVDLFHFTIILHTILSVSQRYQAAGDF